MEHTYRLMRSIIADQNQAFHACTHLWAHAMHAGFPDAQDQNFWLHGHGHEAPTHLGCRTAQAKDVMA
eukprot:353069-Chlamydomonas_euryale.AAC.17